MKGGIFLNNIQVSKNFMLKEFQCKDGNYQVRLDSTLLLKLQKLRDALGKPIIINSGYRTKEHNKAIGGSPNSQHLLGRAVDISIVGMKPDEVAKVAEGIGFGGIGIYKTFVHLDIRSNKARWTE